MSRPMVSCVLLIGLTWCATVQAADPARLAVWCADSTKTQAGQRAFGELKQLWKLLGVTQVGYKRFNRTARKLGIESDQLLKPASIQRVCGRLKLDGLVMGHARTETDRVAIAFHLYNRQGNLLLVKSYPLRRKWMGKIQLERLAGELLDRLGRRPGLVVWSVDETQKGLGKHTEALLAKSFENRGVRSIGFSTYYETAQAMGIHYDDLLRGEAIKRIQKFHGFGGILLIKATRQGRRYNLDFHLYNRDGRLLLVKAYRLRRPAMLERQVEDLVFDVWGIYSARIDKRHLLVPDLHTIRPPGRNPRKWLEKNRSDRPRNRHPV